MNIKRYQVVKLDGHMPVTKDEFHLILSHYEFRSLFSVLNHMGTFPVLTREVAERLHYQMSQWLSSGEVEGAVARTGEDS